MSRDQSGLQLTVTAGPFDDPLQGWANDDLLLDDAAREAFAHADPRLAEVVDWPELRALFRQHDVLAGQFRRRSQRMGVLAILLAAGGVIAAGLAPLLAEVGWEDVAAGVAATLTVAGGVLGFWHWGRSRGKNAWMAHRVWTERLRQLYFQQLVADLPRAAAALESEAALAQWRADRQRLLAALSAQMRDAGFRIWSMRRDLTDGHTWLDRAWVQPPSLAPASSAAVARLLGHLEQRRLGVQVTYTQKKLQQTVTSPRTLTSLFRATGDVLSLAIVVVALVTAVALLGGATTDDVAIKALLGGGAAAGAIVAVTRALDEGLRFRVDAERYESYLAAVERLDAGFRSLDDAGKVRALWRLEELAYQELRRFVDAHLTARFIY